MIRVSVEAAIAEVDSASEDDIAYGNSEILQHIYDHYVVTVYLGGTGVAVAPRHFIEDWVRMSKREKENFVRVAFTS